MLTDEQLNQIAAASAGRKNGTPIGSQQQAAKKALVTAMKMVAAPTLHTGQAPDVTVAPVVPTQPVVIVVISTMRVPREHYDELLPRLMKARDTFVGFEVVTLGNRGSEERAVKWCASNHIQTRQFAVLPHIVQPGGDTVLDTRPIQRRDDKLQAYLGKAGAVFVIGHGDRTSPAWEWNRIEGMIRKVRAWFPPAEQRPQLKTPTPAQPGRPDVEGAVIDADIAAVGYDTEAEFEAAMQAQMDS